FQAEDGIRDPLVTGVQTCALPICAAHALDLHPAGPLLRTRPAGGVTQGLERRADRECYDRQREEVDNMLKQVRAAAMLPAQDLERAKAFYRDKVGLTPTQERDPMGGLLFELSDGTGFAVFQSTGKPSGTHTQMALEVPDLDA